MGGPDGPNDDAVAEAVAAGGVTVAAGGVAVAVFDGVPVPHAVRSRTIGAIAVTNNQCERWHRLLRSFTGLPWSPSLPSENDIDAG